MGSFQPRDLKRGSRSESELVSLWDTIPIRDAIRVHTTVDVTADITDHITASDIAHTRIVRTTGITAEEFIRRGIVTVSGAKVSNTFRELAGYAAASSFFFEDRPQAAKKLRFLVTCAVAPGLMGQG